MRAVLSTNARSFAGLTVLPLPVAVEMMAQSALLLQGGDPEVGRKGFLAAVDGVRLRGVVRAGDELAIDVVIAGKFGPLVRFSAKARRGRKVVATAEITVKTGQ